MSTGEITNEALRCGKMTRGIPLEICDAPIKPSDLCAERLGGNSYWVDNSRPCGLHEFASPHRMSERSRRRGLGHDFKHGWLHIDRSLDRLHVATRAEHEEE